MRPRDDLRDLYHAVAWRGILHPQKSRRNKDDHSIFRARRKQRLPTGPFEPPRLPLLWPAHLREDCRQVIAPLTPTLIYTLQTARPPRFAYRNSILASYSDHEKSDEDLGGHLRCETTLAGDSCSSHGQHAESANAALIDILQWSLARWRPIQSRTETQSSTAIVRTMQTSQTEVQSRAPV